MMEAASTCETFVNHHQTTQRNNPEDSHHHPQSTLHKKETCWNTMMLLNHAVKNAYMWYSRNFPPGMTHRT
jgi:hypothetical protein